MHELHGSRPAAASVIVRSKDKADTIAAALRSLRDQTVPVEIIVVDSGSTDATVDIARELADRVVSITPGEFTYGGALNLGSQASTTPFIFALSAHCVAAAERWIEIGLSHLEDPHTAGVAGAARTPDGRRLHAAVRADARVLRIDDYWGFSNHASGWRRDVWERFAFRTDLRACEDKEWALRVVDAGFSVVIDPDMRVKTTHRRADGSRALFERCYREGQAMALIRGTVRYDARAAVGQWWSQAGCARWKQRWRRRLRADRIVEIGGRYVGERSTRARLP